MSDVLALAAGTLLAVGALSFVLAPLFVGARPRGRKDRPQPALEDGAIRALREIEFDRATGKLSDADYAQLKREYGTAALAQMRAGEQSAPPPAPANAADAIEDRVRAYRAARRECPQCGLRPETDAIYCSNCGGYLDEKCPDCGSAIKESAAGFCSSCGATLAAARS